MMKFDTWRRNTMKVFISWSGDKSQKVAEILKQWIPCVIQSVEPYFSSADIDKGARWSTDIAKELQNASLGILCVTKENLDSAWLNFEAGALSKSIDQSKVCPLLIDLKPTDIQDSPILQFQMANTTQDDIFKLLKSINGNLGELSLSEEILSTTFEMFWPRLDEELKTASASVESTPSAKKSSKDSQASIEEILELVRYQHKLLKTPDELIPPSYLFEVFRQIGSSYPKDWMMDINEQVHMILMVANDALTRCEREGGDVTDCVDQIKEIVKRLQRLSMELRRRAKRPEFLF